MPIQGWKRLLLNADKFAGKGNFPIEAYSEFMPPPRLGFSPYTRRDSGFFAEEDPWGWPVTEYEEAFQLVPGLHSVAQQILKVLVHLARGEPAHGISRIKLLDNPYWPEELARHAGALAHERFVIILPLALSRSQDDKGRVRWTLFGGSEQGPSRAFWRGFYTSPGSELPEEHALGFICKLVGEVYGAPLTSSGELYRAGFRILIGDHAPASDDPHPSWTSPYLWTAGQSLDGVHYMLTFTPFSKLPPPVRGAYLEGRLHLLPFPGSLLFWGAPAYLQLQRELPLALQIPLLHSVSRHEGPQGLRIPQSGWLHEPGSGQSESGDLHAPFRNTYIRTHRWARVHRHEDETAVLAREDKLAHVLFSARPDDVELYGKPMARNAQIWTHDYHLLLDGPHAASAEIRRAFQVVSAGGMFGYRFQFPAMRVGLHEVYWHRPLVAYQSPATGEPVLLQDWPPGFLTAYRTDRLTKERPVELWPRLLERENHLAASQLFEQSPDDRHPHQTAQNVRKLFDVAASVGMHPLPRTFAHRLLTLGKYESLDDWLESLSVRATEPVRGRRLAAEIGRLLETQASPSIVSAPKAPVDSLTYGYTANRSFETRYWNTIRKLAAGAFVNKCNADCVRDPVTLKMLHHHHRDLEALGDYLLAHYAQVVSACGLGGKILVGELPFRWKTDFDFDWSGGWLSNQQERTHERNLLVVIPGRDRRRAVIMADHYDTAYMEDVYDKARGGSGARIAAAGADDNHSATAALMLAAPVLCRLSCAGNLGCDVWLVHLTGEEFPSDCMGARQLCRQLVEGTLKIHLAGGRSRDLSRVQVQGVYVLDMVAHNNDHARDIFQIAPGAGAESLRLAYRAHRANEAWNSLTGMWNRRASRRGRGRGCRSADGNTIPRIAEHPVLHGEVRLPYDSRSTLYNTDGQIFSDVGIPVVLFMENYDINRAGYHDSHDTMANIDLDYGSAVVAITIESVVRAATVP
ncbi:MAG: Zn-dependent exopeptidase M28 [Acidobacteriia bacterium]|nr:Zn-dependent exopeptidase M28 [Terriglobia bacterium]